MGQTVVGHAVVGHAVVGQAVVEYGYPVVEEFEFSPSKRRTRGFRPPAAKAVLIFVSAERPG